MYFRGGACGPIEVGYTRDMKRNTMTLVQVSVVEVKPVATTGSKKPRVVWVLSCGHEHGDHFATSKVPASVGCYACTVSQ